jgi:protein-S-isoprenylcysteine O-methyltransferase Ste14
MQLSVDTIPGFVFTAIMLCWIAFAGGFFLRKRHPASRERKRDKAARYGLLLEASGYALVWSFRRPQFSPIVPSGFALTIVIGIIAIGLGVCSTWMVLAAVRTLGKHWSVAARLIDDHALITNGPYSVVRNPIYTGMLGMMLATGLAVSYWWILPPAILLFWIGTMLRIKSEERLLREAFGNEFEQYSRRVPVLVPFLKGQSG